jgi:hypothetical protein
MREGGECANKMIVLWPDAAWNTGQLWPEQAGISVNLSIPPPPHFRERGTGGGGGGKRHFKIFFEMRRNFVWVMQY